ncbi:MAG TPA: radical SAM protein [Planctomycetes bacterium]|nr:radical SAM protein [Planctomycetota bacterium]HIJ70699.1 radical SAM protein [Planctomycetota bacterium]
MINVSKMYRGLAGQSDSLRYASSKTNRPIVVYNCTFRCNLKCLHCYSASEAAKSADELSTAQAKDLISQIADFGCPVVLFSGGEPLMRGDLFELIAHAGKSNIKAVISTNGTLIDGQAAEKLKEAGVSYVGISIDGPEAFHDKFRAVDGSYQATMQGFNNCRKAGLRTGLRFTITKYNADQIETVFDIAEKAGVRRICFYHLIRMGRAKDIPDQALEPKQTRRAVDTITEKTDRFVSDDLVDEVLTVGNHADGPYIVTRLQQENSPLAAEAVNLLLVNGGNRIGQNIAAVSWDGRVYPDQFWRNYSLGNITEKNFGEIWNNSDDSVLHILRNKNEYRDLRCAKCKWFDLCKGNFRFLGSDSSIENWQNEPACYLTDKEIGITD